ncbi:MAG TPA: hypothetical protein VEB69_07470 [Acidimicrobiia bacterium]|nr:hypothetical protein [Acidimicrobiia bacterium]
MAKEHRASSIALGVTSGVLAVIACGLLLATVALVWLYVQQGPDGFLESRNVDLSTSGYAIVSEELQFEGAPAGWLPADLIGMFRVEAESSSASVFLGLGPSSEVDEYLDGVDYSRVSGLGPFSGVDYQEFDGGPAEDPNAQDFWAATAQGPGAQQIEWEAESGDWTILVMNEDASSGVNTALSVAIANRWLPLAALVTGLIFLVTGVGATLTGLAAFRRARQQTTATVDKPELSDVAG